MFLNEDLAEAIALGHDLGHTPFGHGGETVLQEIHSPNFSHPKQSLRVVDVIENNGRGLNLTHEVRDGILKHSKGYGKILPDDPRELACTIEGRIVRVSDIMAYLNHDLDDAIRSGRHPGKRGTGSLHPNNRPDPSGAGHHNDPGPDLFQPGGKWRVAPGHERRSFQRHDQITRISL